MFIGKLTEKTMSHSTLIQKVQEVNKVARNVYQMTNWKNLWDRQLTCSTYVAHFFLPWIDHVD